MPAPTLTSAPPLPEITPLTSVDESFEPTVNVLAPMIWLPAPSIEPAVMLAKPVGSEMSSTPPASVMKRAPSLLPALMNWVVAPMRVVMVAVPAELKPRKVRLPPLMMVAFSAELLS